MLFKKITLQINKFSLKIEKAFHCLVNEICPPPSEDGFSFQLYLTKFPKYKCNKILNTTLYYIKAISFCLENFVFGTWTIY